MLFKLVYVRVWRNPSCFFYLWGLKHVADHFFEAIQCDNRADQSGIIWSRSGQLEKTILGEMPAYDTLFSYTMPGYCYLTQVWEISILQHHPVALESMLSHTPNYFLMTTTTTTTTQVNKLPVSTLCLEQQTMQTFFKNNTALGSIRSHRVGIKWNLDFLLSFSND